MFSIQFLKSIVGSSVPAIQASMSSTVLEEVWNMWKMIEIKVVETLSSPWNLRHDFRASLGDDHVLFDPDAAEASEFIDAINDKEAALLRIRDRLVQKMVVEIAPWFNSNDHICLKRTYREVLGELPFKQWSLYLQNPGSPEIAKTRTGQAFRSCLQVTTDIVNVHSHKMT